MGLDTTHGAFHGAYSAFSRFRDAFIKSIGGRTEEQGGFFDRRHLWFFPEGMDSGTHPGIYVFMCHSDSDGEIAPEMCAKIADEMEALLPLVEAYPDNLGGHIERDGGFLAVTKRWIAGCRAAAAEGVPLEFR